VRLVEDEGVRPGEDFAEAFLLQGQIRHEQMVVDHDDIGFHGLATRLDHVAIVEERALRTQAILRRGRDPWPHRGILGNVDHLHAVATTGTRRPGADRGELAGQLAVGVALADGLVEAVQAQIVGPAL
jgi:hypothetical protein